MRIQSRQKKITFAEHLPCSWKSAGLFTELNSHSGLAEVYSCVSLIFLDRKTEFKQLFQGHVADVSEAEFKPGSDSLSCALSTVLAGSP